MSKNLRTLLIFLSIGILSFFIVFRSPNIADYDSFYHMGHAKLYAKHGIFNTSFPWVQYSVINKYGGDLWYGFHLLLIPFTSISDVHEIKIATLAITFISLSLIYLSLKNLSIRFAPLWVLAFPFLPAAVLYRLAMLRPHVLSLGLSFLLLSAIHRKQTKIIFLSSFFISFVHINVIWIPLLMWVALAVGSYIKEKKINFESPTPLLSGIGLGILLHPNLWGTLKLLYVQLIESIAVKSQNIPLRFGGELYPADMNFFIEQILPLLLLLVPIAIIFWRKIENKKDPLIIALSFLSAIYLALTLFVANRFIELAVVAFVFLLAVLFSQLSSHSAPQKRMFIGGGVLVFGFLLIASWSTARSSLALAESPPYEKFKYPAQWLKEHTQPGDIVFHVHWGRFPALFYWNNHNYYINGMDPIFMYEYSQELYWMNFFIEANIASDTTCPDITCPPTQPISTYTALKEYFKASYVVVQPEVNATFNTYLAKNPKLFPLVFESSSVRIYAVK